MVKKSTTNVRTKDNGSISRVLRGKMPEVARAEAMARTKMALELIYTAGTTLKGNYSPKTLPGTPGTPWLTLLLTHFSLLQ